MPILSVYRTLCLPALFFAASLASAQNMDTTLDPVATPVAAPAPDLMSNLNQDNVWKCSRDGNLYTLTHSDALHIAPIGNGQIAAEIPIKIDKKGKTKLEGRWGGGDYGGLLVIQKLQPDTLTGYMLVPSPGLTSAACNSRKASVLYSFGQTLPCLTYKVVWTLQPGVTPLQAAHAALVETIQSITAAAQQSSDTGSSGPAAGVDTSLVGTWSNVTSSAVSYASTHLELMADGTYTKTFGARPTGGGGGVIGAGTLGDTHTGTWTVIGPMQVRLSGDARHQPYTQDLRNFTRQ